MCTIEDRDGNSFTVSVTWNDPSQPQNGGTIQYHNPQRPTPDGNGRVTFRTRDRAFTVSLGTEFSSVGNLADGPEIPPSVSFTVVEGL